MGLLVILESGKTDATDTTKIRQKEEILAMHIENVVVGELRATKKEKYENLEHSFTYQVMPILKTETTGSIFNRVTNYYLSAEIHVLDVGEINSDYYNKGDLDIKKEADKDGLYSIPIEQRFKELREQLFNK